MNKPHISPTQLDMFCRCPEAYRRRYIEREVIPPGIAAAKGKGFHRGAETNMRQKIDSHVDLPKKDIIDAAVSGFEAETHGGLSLSEEESVRGTRLVLGEAKDALVSLVECHAKFQAPDYQPILVEQTVRIDLPDAPCDLLGIVDLADDRGRVVDFKTAARKKSQADVDASVQLTVYAAAYWHLKGEAASEVRLDTVVQTKTKTDRQVLSASRDADDFDALANRINAVVGAIQAGSFPPAPPGSWWCSPRWCGYYSTCPYVNSKKVSQGD